jgi:hypothetical protein
MNTLKTYLSLLFYVALCLSVVCCRRATTRNTIVEQEAAQDTIVEQEIIQAIRDFYVAYTTNFISASAVSNDSLVRNFLTKNLIERVDRMRTASGADPIIRAQDFREDIIKTIKVRHLESNWYEVRYDDYSPWVADNRDRHTAIPLRVTKMEGHYMINYITPHWNGALYGDSLLYDYPERQEVDASTPMSLLKTFYMAYTTAYCSLPENLNRQLATLRTGYLTPNALAQFESAGNEYMLDGEENYDLLIDGFDFDRLWIPSIKFTQLDGDIYQLCYIKYNTPYTLELKIIRQDKEYRIDSIIKGV